MPPTTDDGLDVTAMDRAAIRRLLRETGHGVLALVEARERPYAVPMSFGYDGEDIYFNAITFDDESRKGAILETHPEACLTVVDVPNRFDWRSVVVRGRVEPVDEGEFDRVERTMNETAWFPLLSPPPGPITSIDRYRLHPAEMTGRAGPRA